MTASLMRIALTFWVAVALSLTGCATVPRRVAVVGEQAPSAAFSLTDGSERRLEEARGRVVVLAFFTTWCPASRSTLQAIERQRARTAPKGVEFIAIGEGASASEIGAFAANLGLRAPVAFDGGGVLASQLGVPTIPAVLVIAPDGSLRHVHAGYHGDADAAAISREVDALLEATTPETAAPPETTASETGEER